MAGTNFLVNPYYVASYIAHSYVRTFKFTHFILMATSYMTTPKHFTNEYLAMYIALDLFSVVFVAS